MWSFGPVAPFDHTYAEVYEREGIIQETKHLSKARGHTFGRHAEWCDVILPKVRPHAISTRDSEALAGGCSRHVAVVFLRSQLGSISRQHAGLVHTKQGPVLIDLFSSHGTTLNSTKLSAGQPYALHEGDVARFGESAFFKFKGTGRPKREAGTPIKPIVPPAGYQPMTEDSSSGTAAQAAAGASTAATAAASSGAGAGEKRKSTADSAAAPTSHKNARLSGPGLANPKTDRIRCRHVLVKHVGSRRPSSWRQETITLTKEEARARIEAFRTDLIAGAPSASVLEDRFRKLAKAESDCSSAKHEGDLGFFEFKKMQPPFSEAAFRLKVGDLSPIVETESGLHIIWRKE